MKARVQFFQNKNTRLKKSEKAQRDTKNREILLFCYYYIYYYYYDDFVDHVMLETCNGGHLYVCYNFSNIISVKVK